MPLCGGVSGCCARAATGHATAAVPSREMKSRRFIQSVDSLIPQNGTPSWSIDRISRLDPEIFLLHVPGAIEDDVSYRNPMSQPRPFRVCAVIRRRFPVGASPTRRTLQPEAAGAAMEV